MSDAILLVVGPDEHYEETVSRPAVRRGLVSAARSCLPSPESFAAALGAADKSRLILAKGMLETADFLRLILSYNDKELLVRGADGKGFLSHSVILERPVGPSARRILSDAAIHIAPDAAAKARIAKNAIGLARAVFGNARPIVSMLTPQGKLNDKIQSSIDGDFVIRALDGENAEIRLDQLDTAISADARRVKNLPGGAADVLICSDLGEGNSIWKCHTQLAGYLAAGLVCGAAVPIVLNSRADAAESKLLAVEYAAKLMRAPGAA
jgi:phosphotransacetylase